MAQPALFCLRRFVPAEEVLDLVFEFVGARCTLCEECTGRALLDGSRQWQWWCMDCALLALDWEDYNCASHTGWLAEPMGSSTWMESFSTEAQSGHLQVGGHGLGER